MAIASLKGVNTARQGIGFRVTVDDRELSQLLGKLGRAGSEAAKAGMLKVADKIVARAKTLSPVDPEDGGDLRDSIRRTRGTISKKNGNVVVSVLAGGAALKGAIGGRKYNIYAVLQHEDLTLKHSVGQAKFLERPFFDLAPSAPSAIQDELAKVMR